ncbi:hypothetical protein GSI_03535 [Ganoderma sinense ZZ0214-1]|uniref:Mtf2-like C-terminal domain-containing protein n=1 Tax=Ganoderma sinense ZZ0214-1 TaxID=1077348 RepID=A0A2G8SJ90_9APHY|nr:hypothetical protein GSI_03535 [Ganoderma sinense ZZ0214-1]
MLARQGLARVCPCSGARCLAASFSGIREAGRQAVQRRGLSTDQKPISIFSPEASPWDEIFDDIKDTAGPPPRVNPRSLKSSSVGRGDSHAARAVAMTRRESAVFNNMFNLIFDSANAATGTEGGIGHLPGNSPVAGQLRRRLRWTTDADQELDRKKEAMELCETDLELLEWAMREVFGQSGPAATGTSTETEAGTGGGAAAKMSSAYPHLLAALMRTFRDKYRDPHLALAMFDHARNLSIASYVFGCTTPAYNELLETRWWCFRDLRGVVDALEEMRVNGIALDGRTRMLTETVRREVGERTLWQEESSLGSGEVWEMLARIERLTAESVSEGKNKRRGSKTSVEAKGKGPATERARKPRKWSAAQEMWKKDALDANARDGWAFDQWKLQKPASVKKQPLRF